MILRIIFTLLFVSVSTVGMAQEFTLVGNPYMRLTRALTDIDADSIVYLPDINDPKTDKEHPALHYIPFFAFDANSSGKLNVELLDTNSDEKKSVVITLIVSPSSNLETAAALIRLQAAQQPNSNFPNLKDFSSDKLMGIPFRHIKISESTSYGFKDETLMDYSTPRVFRLRAELPNAEAERLADGLRENHMKPSFQITYSLAAKQRISLSTGKVSNVFYRDTQVVKRMQGAGTLKEKFGWTVDSGGIALRQGAITRDQKNKLQDELKEELFVNMSLEDDRDLEYLDKYLQQFYSRVFTESPLNIESSLGKQLAHMNSFDFDPADISPDQIDSIIVDVKQFFQNESEDHFTLDTHGAASSSGNLSLLNIIGIGVSAAADGSLKTTKATLRKSMEDKGWRFETSGKFIVPKSFNVYLVNDSALRTSSTLTFETERASRDFIYFTAEVATSQRSVPPDRESVRLNCIAAMEQTRDIVVKGRDAAHQLGNVEILATFQALLRRIDGLVRQIDATRL